MEVVSIIIAGTVLTVLFVGERWRKKELRKQYLEKQELKKLLDVYPMEVDDDVMSIESMSQDYLKNPVKQTYLDKTHKNNIKYE